MAFNLFDIFIILFLLMGFVTGYRRGIIKQGVITIGTFLVVVLSFLFKNSLSLVLYKHFPFITSGLLKNYSILNILLYELASFFILLFIFSMILAIIIKISGLVEKLVRLTIILAVPSKILGGILGALEYYIFCYIILLIITMPIFSINSNYLIKNSSIKDKILNNTFIISRINKGVVNSVYEVNDLLNYSSTLGTKEFNCKALKVFVKNKIVSKKSINYLKENNNIDNKCKIN